MILNLFKTKNLTRPLQRRGVGLKIIEMTKQEKNDVIEVLKGKFSQYSNFYITDTESLSVAQITTLRSHCFDKQVEMKVAKNTLIKKALESIDAEKYAGVFDSLHKVTDFKNSANSCTSFTVKPTRLSANTLISAMICVFFPPSLLFTPADGYIIYHI